MVRTRKPLVVTTDILPIAMILNLPYVNPAGSTKKK
jgi:hypothetical protein